MEAMFRLWWQQIKKYWVAILVVAIFLVVAIVLIIVGYKLDWTGFKGDTIRWQPTTTNGTSLPIRLEEQQPAKTLWDWLELLGILAIPVVVGLGTVLFTTKQAKAEADRAAQQLIESDKNRDKRHDTDIEIAEKNRESQQQTNLQIAADNRREAALQAYIDKMSELLLHENLRESTGKHEVWKIARVRTLTVLPRLVADQKRSLLQFLYEAQLINEGQCIVDLAGADLHGATLYGADLHGATLHGADLGFADLRYVDLGGADLGGANLSTANLNKANLSEADLSGANLWRTDLTSSNLSGAKVTEEQLKQVKSLEGATMPDGSIHP